jgi:hypothetical protein
MLPDILIISDTWKLKVVSVAIPTGIKHQRERPFQKIVIFVIPYWHRAPVLKSKRYH